MPTTILGVKMYYLSFACNQDVASPKLSCMKGYVREGTSYRNMVSILRSSFFTIIFNKNFYCMKIYIYILFLKQKFENLKKYGFPIAQNQASPSLRKHLGFNKSRIPKRLYIYIGVELASSIVILDQGPKCGCCILWLCETQTLMH